MEGGGRGWRAEDVVRRRLGAENEQRSGGPVWVCVWGAVRLWERWEGVAGCVVARVGDGVHGVCSVGDGLG